MFTEMLEKIKAAASERAGLGVMLNTISDAQLAPREQLVRDILANSAEVMKALRSLPAKAPAKPVVPEKPAEKPFSGFAPEPPKFNPTPKK